MTDHDRHWTTLLSIKRSPTVPSVSGERLRAAEDAGLCRFNAWVGVWRLTDLGCEVLYGSSEEE